MRVQKDIAPNVFQKDFLKKFHLKHVLLESSQHRPVKSSLRLSCPWSFRGGPGARGTAGIAEVNAVFKFQLVTSVDPLGYLWAGNISPFFTRVVKGHYFPNEKK